MKLYTINQLISDTLSQAIDPETGEILHDDLVERLEQLEIEKETLILDLACEYKDLIADRDKHKAEAKRQSELAKSCESKADTIERVLVKFANGNKFKDSRASISWRASASVNVEDPQALRITHPDLVRIETEYKADKTAIKNLLKAGQDLPGCELIEKDNIQIK
jgi:hypothetical protein